MNRIKFFAFTLIAFVMIIPAVTHAAITSTVSQTATDVTVSYHYSGVPTSKTYFYSWLSDAGTGTWVNRNKLLTTAGPSSSTVTKDFTVTYDFASLNLQNGTRYVYYIADGTDDSANLLTSPAYFTPGGTNPTNPGGQQGSAVNVTLTAVAQHPGNATGKYQEGFTLKPSAAPTSAVTFDLKIFSNSSSTSTLVSQNQVVLPANSTDTLSPGTDDLDAGDYTAVLYQGTNSITNVSFTLGAGYQTGADDGVCNGVYDRTVSITIDSSMTDLCTKGTMGSFNAASSLGPWTWKCNPVSHNGTADTCTATHTTSSINLGTPTTTQQNLAGLTINFLGTYSITNSTASFPITITSTVADVTADISSLYAKGSDPVTNPQSVFTGLIKKNETKNATVKFTGLTAGQTYAFTLKDNTHNNFSTPLQFVTTGGTVKNGGSFSGDPTGLSSGQNGIPPTATAPITDTISDKGIVPKCGRTPGPGVLDSQTKPCNFHDFMQLVANVMTFAVILIAPVVTCIAIYAGIMIMILGEKADPTAKQSEDLRKYKQVLLRVAIGIVIMLVAWTIVATILNALGVKPEYILLDIFNRS